MSKLTIQEELLVSAIIENPEYSELKLAKKTKIPKNEVAILMKRPALIRALDEKRREISGESLISVKRIVQEEMCVAFADPIDLVDKDGVFLTLDKLPERIRRAISKIDYYNKDGVVNIRYQFSDKGKSLERIGKHLGMYEKDNSQKQGRIIFIRHDEAAGFIDITPEEDKPVETKKIEHRTVSLMD